MSNKDLLVILNPRNHDASIKSLKNLKVPKVWISGFNEFEALKMVMKIVNGEDIHKWSLSGVAVAPIFENYIMISDDVIVTQKNIDVIINNNDKYDVLTGYCNLNPKSKNINVVPVEWGKKLTLSGERPTKSDYPFYQDGYTRENIMEKISDDIFETYSIGFSLTSFKRHVLQEYKLCTYQNSKRGGASDHHISHRIVKDGKYKMFAHKDCYFDHLKLKRISHKKDQKIIWEI